MKLARKLFRQSGDDVIDRLEAPEAEDRGKFIRVIEMLIWNALVVVGTLVIVL